MTPAERRQIGQAIREYDQQRSDEGRSILCRLAKDHAPPMPISPLDRFITTRMLAVAPLPDDAIGAKINGVYFAKPQPKPRKRLVSRAAIMEYVQTHPDCEVLNCGRRPCPEPHHLVSRKMGGDDVASNLIMLCARCHRAYHAAGARTWLFVNRKFLTADTLAKVERAALGA